MWSMHSSYLFSAMWRRITFFGRSGKFTWCFVLFCTATWFRIIFRFGASSVTVVILIFFRLLLVEVLSTLKKKRKLIPRGHACYYCWRCAQRSSHCPPRRETRNLGNCEIKQMLLFVYHDSLLLSVNENNVRREVLRCDRIVCSWLGRQQQ